MRTHMRAVFFLSALGLLGAVGACKTQATPAANQEANLTTVVIPVEGMSCVSCAARIKKTLNASDGVGHVEVSLGERSARVRFDSSRLSPDRFVAAIDGLGYHAGVPSLEARP
ncbi:MAG: heavy metal-associated domain-containing protein [Dehalococcoidia bacterium]|nr:heavy metal-associated domain-containing protein [Dehalococcoidia bacterium]